jgi:hypothetical protein
MSIPVLGCVMMAFSILGATFERPSLHRARCADYVSFLPECRTAVARRDQRSAVSEFF